jgi:hypothetical protein
MSNASHRIAPAIVVALALTACSDSNRAFQANVTAASGGVFSDDAARPSITVRIPAGALAADAVLHVEEVKNAPAAGANQVAASTAWRVALTAANGGPAPAISRAIQIELPANPAPAHPQLGEIARLSGTTWQRLQASFYRPSTQVVAALTTEASGTYRTTLRSLQRESGAAVDRGFQVFMYETFGNEAFFSGGLGLAALLEGVKPVDAVALGVQVDLDKVPAAIVAAMTDDTPAGIDAKVAALNDPATTIALVKAGAVVGVVDRSPAGSSTLTSVGVTCALCHQVVKPTAFTLKDASGNVITASLPIGELDVNGVPNAAMDAGKILSLTAGAQGAGLAPTLAGWGANRFDVRNPATANAALDDQANDPTDTPPIWNFVDLDAAGYPYGWDGLFAGENALASQAEAVYHLVMGGKGAFGTANGALPPALRVTPPSRILDALPGAAVPADQILITRAKLLDLQAWMRSIASPAPGAFDEAKAEQGFAIFNGKGACNTCHTTPELSGTKSGPFLANITATPAAGDLAGGIKVPGLRGVSRTAPYFHDDSAATLPEAVERVTTVVTGVTGATFTADEKAALVEYLESL